MLRNAESPGNYAHQATGELSEQPFIPPKDQMGLFEEELLPLSHRIPEELPTTLAFPIEVEADNGERKIQQGEFERHKLAELNTVVQQRKIYEDIDVLAANIREEGLLIHPLFVVRYTSEEAAHSYLVAAYGTVGKKVPPEKRKRIVDLTPSTHNGQKAWYIVIAGHRRLRALEMEQEEDSVVQVFENMNPFRALKVQVSENTSILPKDFERAEQNGDLWAVDKALDPKLTVNQFAKRVGHRPEVIKRDLLYYGLPDEIKNLVVPRGQIDTGRGNTQIANQPLMPFRVASQLGRLVEKDVPNHDTLFLARRFWDENLASEEEASKRVSAYLKAYEQGDVGMKSLFNINAAETAKLRRNHEVGQRFVTPLDSAIRFFRQVALAKKYGLPIEEDGVSFTVAARHMRILGQVMDGLLPEMKQHLSSAKRAEIKGTLIEWEKTARQFGKLGQITEVDLGKTEMTSGDEFELWG